MALTILETLTQHDGEPMHWWDWAEPSLAPQDDPRPANDNEAEAAE